MVTIIGLGNPGKEYERTRHNSGRDTVALFAKKISAQGGPAAGWEFNKKAAALITEGKIGKTKIVAALPETFMNKSGSAIAKLVRPRKELKDLVVIHDDIDIPIGRMKISYGKNSGGHKGVESVMRALKTKNFVRIRIGICPKRKPPTEKDILKFIIGKFAPAEQILIKKTQKRIIDALEVIAAFSLERAMSEFNK